jgi:hypothetical protein
MAHDVFISYSNKDKTIADAACATLESAGIRCWVAPRDIIPGVDWAVALMDAIEQSRVLVLVFTKTANDSPQIRSEIERAVTCGIPIIPLRVEDILPGKALGFFINKSHWLDAISPPLEAHLRRLVDTIRAILASARPVSSQPQPQAPLSPSPLPSVTTPSNPQPPAPAEINYQTAPRGSSSAGMILSIISVGIGVLSCPSAILPICGCPAGIAAIACGAIALFKLPRSDKRNFVRALAITGIALAVISMVFTIINSSIGAYKGFTGH